MAVHFGDLNWMQVEEYLRRDDRLMVVTGACEQHGYLSLMTDIRIPLAGIRRSNLIPDFGGSA